MATTPPVTQATSVSYSAIASRFLADLGAPDTRETNAAVVTWVKGESGGSILSNNPWNIHYDVAQQYKLPGVVGYRKVSNGEVVAVFSDLNTGIDASAKYISFNQHGYPQAVAALKRGDAVGFLNGIAASDWAGSHYGATVNSATHTITGGVNSLVTRYHQALGSSPSTGGNVGTGGDMAPVTAVTQISLDQIFMAIYGPFGDLYSPNDILTQQWIDNMHSHLYGDGSALNTGVKGLTTAQKDAIMASLNAGKGKRLGDIYIPIDLATILGVKAEGGLVGVGPTDPATGAYVGPGSEVLDPLTGLLGPLVGAITDPAKWVGILALVAGIGLVGFGIVTLVHGYASSSVAVPHATAP